MPLIDVGLRFVDLSTEQHLVDREGSRRWITDWVRIASKTADKYRKLDRAECHCFARLSKLMSGEMNYGTDGMMQKPGISRYDLIQCGRNRIFGERWHRAWSHRSIAATAEFGIARCRRAAFSSSRGILKEFRRTLLLQAGIPSIGSSQHLGV